MKIKYNNNYEIFEDGKLYSLRRKKYLSPSTNYKGYKQITLINLNTNKRMCKSIHRLVAEHFIPNPENKPQVNHKDGNKLNNHVSNLEWVTNGENQIHAFKNGLQKGAIKIICNETGETFWSISDAARKLNIDAGNLQKVISGKQKTITKQKLTFRRI